jgi:Tol biopolymer transport system component
MRTIQRIAVVGALVMMLGGWAVGQQFSEWSSPTNLGDGVNSAYGDFFPAVSRDGLSLYFTSSRPGGYGGWDIYLSQRPTAAEPWGPPQNLGPTINTPYDEGAPDLSPDGHRMYFASNRPGGFGGGDMYVSRRHNKRDDFGWQTPDNLGAGVNSAANEAGPAIFEDESTGVITLYFDSNRPGGPGPLADNAAHNGNDIYSSTLQFDETFGPAILVAELSTPFFDRKPAIRRDGLELLLASNRPGTFGNLDLWVSTRATTWDSWSAPVNLGPSVNGPGNDAAPVLTFDGATLYFQSDRPGGYGAYDLYVMTRSKQK